MNSKHPQLIDSHGRASAALIDQNSSSLSSVLIDHDGDLAITSTTIQSHFGSSLANSKDANKSTSNSTFESKIMAAFDRHNQHESPQTLSQSALVPFDVPNMGRMAVHRNEVLQIQSMTNSNFHSIDAQSSASSSGSSGSNTSAGLSAESMSSSHTALTMAEDHSFDSSMHSFLTDPHSDIECSKETLLASTSKQSSSLMAILREATASLPKNAKRINNAAPFLMNIVSTPSNEACKPRLEGVRMPRLDWPDTFDGPWSEASRPVTLNYAKKRRAIQQWLEEDSDEDGPTETPVQQHPMIAKVLIDRKRQEDVIRLIASSQASTFTTPKKAKRSSRSAMRNSSSSSKISKRKLAKLRRSKIQTPSSLRNYYLPESASPISSAGLTTPRRNIASINAQIGCQCGRTDDGTPMIQCDGCNMWYHMGCIGLTDSSTLNDDEWYCLVCCEVATSTLTPSSTLSGGLMVTPSFPRSAALAGQQVRLSQGQLPVFYRSDDTPMHVRRDEGHAHAFSSALALAPSPVVSSSVMSEDRRANLVAGRARASRYGWHLAEPGSPLERKSNTVVLGGPPLTHKRNLSGGGLANGHNNFMGLSPNNRQMRTFAQSHSDGDLYGTLTSSNGEGSILATYLRTPSPRLMSTSTPHRQRQKSTVGLNSSQINQDVATGLNSLSGQTKRSHHRMDSNNGHRDSDDVFSTPSRMLFGTSSWGQPGSMIRHSREDSYTSIHGGTITGLSTSAGTPWGLSTPTRHLMDAGFNSDYSASAAGGLPSLVHSSGGLDLDEMSGWHTLQNSPTSHTRAATRRARQASLNARRESVQGGSDVYTSSMRELTPERGFEFDVGSSSPFPKTPIFSSDPYPHLQNSSVTPTASSRSTNVVTSNNKMNSFSRAINGLSPMSSPTTSHSRAGRMARNRLGSLGGSGSNESYNSKNGRDALTALQGPVELRSTNSQQIKSGNNANSTNQTRVRTRDASTDMMAGLGIGFDLNEEWV